MAPAVKKLVKRMAYGLTRREKSDDDDDASPPVAAAPPPSAPNTLQTGAFEELDRQGRDQVYTEIVWELRNSRHHLIMEICSGDSGLTHPRALLVFRPAPPPQIACAYNEYRDEFFEVAASMIVPRLEECAHSTCGTAPALLTSGAAAGLRKVQISAALFASLCDSQRMLPSVHHLRLVAGIAHNLQDVELEEVDFFSRSQAENLACEVYAMAGMATLLPRAKALTLHFNVSARVRALELPAFLNNQRLWGHAGVWEVADEVAGVTRITYRLED